MKAFWPKIKELPCFLGAKLNTKHLDICMYIEERKKEKCTYLLIYFENTSLDLKLIADKEMLGRFWNKIEAKFLKSD